MTESEWSLEEEQVAKPKRRIPKWAWWGCGGGCVVLAIVCGVGGYFGMRMVKEATNVEAQWPRLQQVMAFDQRPTTIQLQSGVQLTGHEQYQLLSETQGLVLIVISADASSAGQFDAFFTPEGLQAPFNLGEPADPELGELELQGRTVTILRFSGSKGLIGNLDRAGQGAWIDLRVPAHPGRVAQVRHFKKEAGPVTDEEITTLFAPFDLWRD